MRITAQLVKVADGFHLWSETYDRELTDIFAVQDDIARSVSSALKVTLLGKDKPLRPRAAATPRPTTSTSRASTSCSGRSEEDLEKAIRYYEQALQLDPGYARAWVGLAGAHATRRTGATSRWTRDTGRAAGRWRGRSRWIRTWPMLTRPWGWIRRDYDWDWSGAEAAFKRALELEPGKATVVKERPPWLASVLGRFEDAIDLGRRAVELDPAERARHTSPSGFSALRAGRLDEAEAALRKALELDPEYPAGTPPDRPRLPRAVESEAALSEMEQEKEPSFWRRFGLALAYHALGRTKEADAALARASGEGREGSAFQIAEVYAFRGEADVAFAWLERAYAQRDSGPRRYEGRSAAQEPRARPALQGVPREDASSRLTGEPSHLAVRLHRRGGARMPASNPLRRSRRHRMIAGVCGGLAEWLGWDPTLVRVLYVVVSIASVAFPGILAYVILWLVMPVGD